MFTVDGDFAWESVGNTPFRDTNGLHHVASRVHPHHLASQASIAYRLPGNKGPSVLFGILFPMHRRGIRN